MDGWKENWEYLKGKVTPYIDRFMDNPVGRYAKETYYIRKSQKTLQKGIHRTAKGIAYIVIYLQCMEMMADIPPGMVLLVWLMLIRGMYHVLKGFYLYYRSIVSRRKAKGKPAPRKIRWMFLTYPSMAVLAVLMALYIFAIPPLESPLELQDGYRWFTWPLIYLVTFVIWAITIKITLLSLFRAYNIGDRLAKISHDAKIIRSGLHGKKITKNQMWLFLSGFIPIIGLIITVTLTSVFRFLSSLASHFFFGVDRFESLGETAINEILGTGYTIGAIDPHLASWYSLWGIYIMCVILISGLSYLRTFSILNGLYSGRLHSPMGKKIETYLDFKKHRMENKK